MRLSAFRPSSVWAALLGAMLLMSAACGGESGTSDTTSTTRFVEEKELILAVDQWPDCINPLTSCSNSIWMSWSVLSHLLPGLLEYDVNNSLRASPVVEEMPTLDNGGVVFNDDGGFTVTYRIRPEARWSDNTPITSTDVRFTWRAVLDTPGSGGPGYQLWGGPGYELISDINADDPQTVAITFSRPYAPWPYMFLRLLPAHAFDGNTDITDYWIDAIPISGGPWLQESWSQDRHVLVPNPNYWESDRMPLVDRVVMIPKEGTDSGVMALQSGEVMVAMPQPFSDAKTRLAGDITFVAGSGPFVEGLWFNQVAPDRRFEITTNLRKAVAHALDRERLAAEAVGSIVDDPEVLQCAGWSPAFGKWCGDDFAGYVQDAEAVNELLSAGGWSRPDPNGLWVNADGEELVLAWNTVAGNQRREDLQALVAEMTEPFGIGWEIINYPAAELFQTRLPTLDYGPVALYAIGTGPDPSVAALYDLDGIPTEANGYRGSNYTAYSSQAATDLAFAIDEEVDQEARLRLVASLGAILAEDVPWIPLYVLPNLIAWNTTLVEGPGEWVSGVNGGFYDMYDWDLVG